MNKLTHLHSLSSGQSPLIGTGHSLEDVLVHHWIMSDTVAALYSKPYINKSTE